MSTLAPARSPRPVRAPRPTHRRGSWLHAIREPDHGPDGPSVAAILSPALVIVTADTEVGELRALLTARHATAAAVTDARGAAVGVVTLAAVTTATATATAADLMIPLGFALAVDAPIARAAALMAYEGADHVLVVEPDGRVLGIVNALDIVRHHARSNGYIVGTPRRW
jgi:CBS domain-containing protein